MSAGRIAIVGAGPIGLEAALHGVESGYDVSVYERGRVGENLRRWGHVVLFSPWEMNRSARAERVIRTASGEPPPDRGSYLSGAQHVTRCLAALAGSPLLAARVHEQTRVVGIARDGVGRARPMGQARRHHPFRLLVETPRGEQSVLADIVFDCSGTYGNPNRLGSGGLPAVGERGLQDRIDYVLVDLAGSRRERFAGRRVLLAGDGHSAATALDALVSLPGTRVIWISKHDREAPLPVVENDPLPERRRLCRSANRLAGGANESVEFRRATIVDRLAAAGEQTKVTLRGPRGSETIVVDRILAHTGSAPDSRIYDELQVHQCYASQGPMALAATLAASDSADCLSQTSAGVETLLNPEPDFFILGSKSYGRNQQFLIRVGLEQIRDVFQYLQDNPKERTTCPSA